MHAWALACDVAARPSSTAPAAQHCQRTHHSTARQHRQQRACNRARRHTTPLTCPRLPTPRYCWRPQFFQKQDNGMSDAFMLATGVAALYLVYKVFESIETL